MKLLLQIPFILIFTVLTSIAFSQQNDTLFHKNGNVIKGEIKKYDMGIIAFKVDGMGTVNVNADEVIGFKSKKVFEIYSKKGNVFYGSFDTSGIDGVIKIITLRDTLSVLYDHIVSFDPIKARFWDKLSGRFTLGFDYTKASNVMRFSYTGDIVYRARKTYVQLDWNGYLTAEPNDSAGRQSDKLDVILNFQQLIKQKWYYSVFVGFNRNTELGLESRTQIGAAIINSFVYTHRNRFYGIVALSPNRETYVENSPTVNIEAVFSLKYNYYKYTSPELHISSELSYFPSLTNWGRNRVNFNLNSSIEIIRNFTVGINGYYNFDNKPADENASTYDFGLTLSLGFIFH